MIRRVNYELYMGEALAEAQVRRRPGRAAPRRGRRPRRGDGRPRPRPRPRDRRPDRPRRRRRPARGRPAGRQGSAPRRDDLLRRWSPARCASARCSRPTSRRSSTPSRTAPTAPPARCSSSPSTPRCGAGSRSSAASAATRSRSSTPPRALRADPARAALAGILSRGEVSEWLMVPLSKSGVRKHRGFESHPLRHVGPHGRPIRALPAPLPRSRTSESARSGARRRLRLDRP